MPTTKRGLPLYDETNLARLDTLLNGQSTQLDNALDSVDWFRVGTIAQRDALPTSVLREGMKWMDSTTGWIYQRTANSWGNSKDVINIAANSPGTSGNQTAAPGPTTITSAQVSLTLPVQSRLRFYFSGTTYSPGAGDLLALTFKRGSTDIASFTRPANSSQTAASTGNAQTVVFDTTLPAGTHAISVSIQRVFGTGNVTIAPSPSNPITLSIDRIG